MNWCGTMQAAMAQPFCKCEWCDKGRYSVFKWEGADVRVLDSAATALRVRSVFSEPLFPDQKWAVARELLFVDPNAVQEHQWDDFGGFFEAVLEEVVGLSAEQHQSDASVIDIDSDDDYISASIWQTYGISVQELAERVTLREFFALVSLCPHETPIGQAIYYRTADEPENANSDAIQEFRRRREFWRLKNVKHPEPVVDSNQRATDVFNAIAQLSKGVNDA